MLFLLFLLTQETHKQIKPIAHLNHTDHPKLNPNTLVEPSQVLSARKPVSRLLLKHILMEFCWKSGSCLRGRQNFSQSSGVFYMVSLQKFWPETKKGGGCQVHSGGGGVIFLERGLQILTKRGGMPPFQALSFPPSRELKKAQNKPGNQRNCWRSRGKIFASRFDSRFAPGANLGAEANLEANLEANTDTTKQVERRKYNFSKFFLK